jgi:hypothetical protein
MTSPEIHSIITAHHEAAHAIVAMRYGREVLSALVNPSDPQTGLTVFRRRRRRPSLGDMSPHDIRRAWSESLTYHSDHIRILLAGPLAEAKLLSTPLRSLGARSDLQTAERLIRTLEDLHDGLSRYTLLPCWPDREGYLNHLRRQTRALISRPDMWLMIERVAEDLKCHRFSDGNHIAAAVQSAKARSGQLGLYGLFEASTAPPGANSATSDRAMAA